MPFKRPLGASDENQKPPNFIRPLQDKRVVVGQNVILECQVDGHPSPAIKWLKDGQNVTNCPDYQLSEDGSHTRLVIGSVQQSDHGRFTCQALNAAGSKSTSCMLIVAPAPSPVPGRPGAVVPPSPGPPPTPVGPAAPLFFKELKHQPLKIGGNAFFECRITGNPNPQVSWMKNGQPISSGYRYKIENDAETGICSLMISMMFAEDVGTYTCRAVNKQGEAKTQAQVMHKEKFDEWMTEEQTKITKEKKKSMMQELDGAISSPRKPKGGFYQPKSHKLLDQRASDAEFESYGSDMNMVSESETEPELAAFNENLPASGPSSPPQFKAPLRDQRLNEGADATLQCSVTGNPRPRIQWIKNGQPLTPSQRYSMTYKGSIVVLKIKMVFPEDQGQYTLLAENQFGRAQSSANLQIAPFNQQGGGYSRFGSGVREGHAPSPTQKAPQFVKTPPDQSVRERQNARFDVKVSGRPTAQVAWFKADGTPLQDGQKYKMLQTQDGNHALTILSTDKNDTGTYLCVARNAVGQVQYATNLSVILAPQQAMGVPQFTEKFQSVTAREGEAVILRCRAEGTPAPTMAWFKDQVQLNSGQPYKIEAKPGETSLTISNVGMDDAGWFTCTATNVAGTTTLRGRVAVTSKQQAAGVPQMRVAGATMGRTQQEVVTLRRIERSQPQGPPREIPVSKEAPKFVSEPKSLTLIEGQAAHFECRFTPVDDPGLKVNWLYNGRSLQASSRVSTVFDFGFATLDIQPVYAYDSGIYQCLAVNSMGESQVQCQLAVTAHGNIMSGTVHPGSLNQIQALEQRRTSGGAAQVGYDEMASRERPNFTSELRNAEVFEGKGVHFEAKLTPQTDPNLTVEWFHNGRALQMGSRFRILHDFGFVALDIAHTIPEDSGTYTCRATNPLGVVESHATLICQAKQQITAEHTWLAEQDVDDAVDDVSGGVVTRAPQFVSQFRDAETKEAGRAHFEARYVPQGDTSLRFDWFKDGRPLKMANRIQTHQDFGFVSLTMFPTYPEDSGVYTCIASNRVGKAQTQAQLVCHGKKSLIFDSQHTDAMTQIQYLEGQQVHIGPLMEDRPEETDSLEKPRFARPLKDAVEVNEGQTVHFECRLLPVSDPRMQMEWFHNGKPLMAASRIRPMYDFGYVALDLLYAYPEDSGTYTVVAQNQLGSASSEAKLAVLSRKTLYLDSQHPEGLERIQQLETPRGSGKWEEPDRICTSAPQFVGQLRDLQLKEMTNMHLELKVNPINDPTMRIEWYVDGRPVLTGSRIHTNFEFGFLSLDASGVIAEDSGTYTVRAVNALGEATASCNVQVLAKHSIVSDTQHIESLEKIQYLESMDKYGRRETEEAGPVTAPVFVKQLPPSALDVPEGTTLHLECQVKPISDNSMRIEWFRDGKSVPAGHRFRTFHDFGFVSLDILTMYPEDGGVYSCVARNSMGEAITQCETSCVGKSAILGQTHHPASVQRISELEAPKIRAEDAMDGPKQTPVFVQPLNDPGEIKEGENVHLECQLLPVDDPDLDVEWYVNGQPLQTGHRFQTTRDFGYISLNILYMYPEDSGVYTVVGRNDLGEASSQMRVTCNSKDKMHLQSYHPASMKRIHELEAPRQKAADEPEKPIQKPEFITHLVESLTDLKEGQTVHLEAQITPVDDPNLKIIWMFNGKALHASHRFRYTHDFGYISLDIMHCYPEDTGTYSCRVINKAGYTESFCKMHCIRLQDIILEPNHPESWKKIKQMEEMKPAQAEEPELEITAPQFTTELNGATELKEGQAMHIECMLLPVNDPKLKLEWYLDGRPLKHANRIRMIHDFGFVGLDITHVHPEDSGVYTCRAVNALGESKTDLKILCHAKRSLYLESQHDQSWQKIQELEAPGEARPPSPDMTFPKPTFTQPLQNAEELAEGQSLRLECRLEPVGDPTLKVVWLRNGQPIPQGSRFMPARNFDYVSLDILTVYPEDSGIYSCRAVSEFGETVTSSKVQCESKSSLLLDTQHQTSWSQIQEIENRKAPEPIVQDLEIIAPSFTQQLAPQLPDVGEGQSVHMECQVAPVNDPNLQVLWFHNGHPLAYGHRFKLTHDFGYCSLDVLYAFPEDTGTWTCRAVNSMGTADTNCQFQVLPKHTILSDTQHPESWQKIQEIEAPKKAAKPVPDLPKEAPRFVQPPENCERFEGQPAHFECRVLPINDNSMTVEWHKDGAPLLHGNRFASSADFGFITLDIGYSLPEDAGTYTCVVKSSTGQTTQSAELAVQAKETLLLDPQNPQSWSKIQQLEAPKGPAPERPEAAITSPQFTQEINSCPELIEGQPAHFEGRLQPINDPKLRVEWFHNGRPIKASSRFTLHHDFGLVSLDIHYCLPEDEGTYTCKAFNSLGQATSAGELHCKARSSIYAETMHEQSWQKIQLIEAPKEAAPLPEPQTFQKPQFTQPLGSIEDVPEGSPAALECRLIPVNDPKLRVEWYFNDKPLAQSNRMAISQDFGHVSLNLSRVYPQDSGVYMCRAVNDLGEAVTTASVQVASKQSLLLDTQHPESYRKVQLLESMDKFPRQEIPDKTFDKPNFTQALENIDNLKEGQPAHLECHLQPAGDPRMRVEWFLNGRPLQNASRFRVGQDFGIATLDIVHVLPEDSGVYSCRAVNAHGESTTSATVKVEGYESIMQQPQHPISWQKIQDLERPIVKEEQELIEHKQKPAFVSHLSNIDELQEGEPIHLEATYEPAKDNSLRATWLKNNQQIQASQLTKTKCELGLASLDIANAYGDHSGMYTLKLRNSEGEAASSVSVKVHGKSSVLGDTQHEQSWMRIQEIEAPKPEAPETPDVLHPPPSFKSHLNDLEVIEGESAHFECQVEPAADPTLKIEWYQNGKPLHAGSKYAISIDFGYCTLDISYAYPEDSGVYMCKATSSQGEAVTSATLKCQAKDSIITSPQNVASAAKVAELEAPKAPVPELPEAQKVAPIFTKQFGDLGELYEGQSAHFEATVEPVDDPTVKTEWYHNGQPVSASSRIKMINDFGWVILDINQVEPRDTGEWTCRAYNAMGEAKASGNLTCVGRENIVLEPQQPQSLEKIMDLERAKEEAPEVPPKPAEPPKFIVPLPAFPPLEEGDSVHLEAQVRPLDDPRLKIQWFWNGKALQFGSRFRTVNDFGYCVLDILNMLPEDTGEYVCRASNAAGEDITKALLECAGKAGLILHPQVKDSKSKAINDLEESLHRVYEDVPEEKQKVAPVFLEPLKGPPPLREGDSAHFEARLQPINDPQMKIDWFVNGRPLKTGSRVKTICDFGFVVLEISPVYPEDSGEYVCKAHNSMGEAVTKADLTCESKQKIISDTQLPSSMSGAQARIRDLEAPKPVPEGKADPDYGGPRFVTELQDMNELVEGQLAHFECQLEPANDPKLKVEWFHDGKAISHSSRMKTIHDFGFVILEIAPAEPHDTGNYVCKASNEYGEATTQANIKVEGRRGVTYEWQMPENMQRQKITDLEDWLRRDKSQPLAPDAVYGLPQFSGELGDLGELMEQEAAHFECQLEPVGDPTLRIEWLHNGKPVPYSSRIQMQHEFGYVVLDIKSLIPEDSGDYTCRATNSKGQSQTTGHLVCKSKHEVDTPVIITPLQNVDGLKEGDNVHLECRIGPTNDPKMTTQWYFNGKSLAAGNRFKTQADFGYVSLDILYAYQEDSGTYTCKAKNEKGEVSTAAEIKVEAKPKLVFQRQAPQLEGEIERHLKQYTQTPIKLSKEDVYQDGMLAKPVFKSTIQNLGVEEGEFARMECQLAPANDPHMKVEWYHDGEPVMMGHRFRSIMDYGFVALDLFYSLPEDTGEYVCRAKNEFGKAECKAKLVCQPKMRIITQSQLPQGMNVASIKKLEEQLYWSQTVEAGEQPRVKCPPVFTIPPRACQAMENEPARFECAVSGFPKPKVYWYINGRQACSGFRYKLNYDGMNYLIVPNTRPSDAGEVLVIARNTEGEAQASASLDIFMANDFRIHQLKTSVAHRTEEQLQQREMSWRREMMGQLGDHFQRAPKPDFQKLQRIEAEKSPPRTLESDELVQKFSKQRADEFYEKITQIDHPRAPPPPLPMETVQLKPSAIQRAELPPTEMETAQLRPAPRSERTGDIPKENLWLESPGFKKPANEQQAAKMFKQRAPEPKEVELPAKDQIRLKSTKPKPAAQAPVNEPVQLEPPKPMAQPKQRTPPPKEEIKPAAEQVKLKPSFRTRPMGGGEAVQLEDVSLKQTPIAPKQEEKKEQISTKPTPAKVGGSAKKPPVLNTKLEPCKSELGRPAKFSVQFSGDRPLTVTWLKDGHPVASSFEFQINTNDNSSTLTMAKVKKEYAGEYTVRVENVAGRSEGTANLLVIDRADQGNAPQFEQILSAANVTQGHPVRFDVKLSGQPEPTVAWFKDGKQINEDLRFKFLVEGKQYTLLIIEAMPQDAGTIECVARNNKGESRCRGQLAVALAKGSHGHDTSNLQHECALSPPVFKENIQALVVQEGKPARFSAIISGAPEPTVKWFRNAAQIKPSKFFVMTQKDETYTLNIKECYQEDEGTYRCEASNMSGKAVSSASLKLQPKAGGKAAPGSKEPPKFASSLQDVVTKLGQFARFSAEISGQPAPSISWIHNGRVLHDSGDLKTSFVNNVATLEIQRVRQDHAGKYSCRVNNQLGQAESSAQLRLEST